jgi:hypothetical protein
MDRQRESRLKELKASLNRIGQPMDGEVEDLENTDQRQSGS